MKLKIMIIDDEVAAIRTLTVILEKFCTKVEIVGTAGNLTHAVALIRSKKPDLLLLDIEMQDHTGFDVLDQLDGHKPSIIFVTAHQHYAIKAIKKEAKDYILKPVDPDELVGAVEQVRSNLMGKAPAYMNNSTIYLNTGTSVEILKKEEVIYVQADGRYSEFHCTDGRRIVICRNIGEYEQELRSMGFFRAHKSILVNMMYVISFGKNEHTVEMKDGSSLPLSRRKKIELVNAIGKGIH